MSSFRDQQSGRDQDHSNGDKTSAEGEQQQRKKEEIRSAILTQILDQNALARLNTLRMMKPERAQMAEQYLVSLAQSGRLGSKVDDDSLVSLLEQMNTQVPNRAPKITFQRRPNPLDDDF